MISCILYNLNLSDLYDIGSHAVVAHRWHTFQIHRHYYVRSLYNLYYDVPVTIGKLFVLPVFDCYLDIRWYNTMIDIQSTVNKTTFKVLYTLTTTVPLYRVAQKSKPLSSIIIKSYQKSPARIFHQF